MLSTLKPILVVDKDLEFATVLLDLLKLEGFDPLGAHTLSRAAHILSEQQIGIILLSYQHHQGNTLTWLKKLEADLTIMPEVLLLLDPSDPEPSPEDMDGLPIVDTIRKPCSLRALSQRLTHHLSQSPKANELPVLHFKGLSLNLSNKTLSFEDKSIALTNTELTISELLIKRGASPVSKEELYRKALNRPMFPRDRVLDVHMSSLRHKIAKITDTLTIEAIRRVGYFLQSVNASEESKTSTKA